VVGFRLGGTSMSSFANVIKPEDAWDLTHSLRSLQMNDKGHELTLCESAPEGIRLRPAENAEHRY
jgi:hypothetical protein